MDLDFKIGFIVVIVIPLLICTLAIINGKSLDDRYYSCQEKHNQQECHSMLE